MHCGRAGPDWLKKRLDALGKKALEEIFGYFWWRSGEAIEVHDNEHCSGALSDLGIRGAPAPRAPAFGDVLSGADEAREGSRSWPGALKNKAKPHANIPPADLAVSRPLEFRLLMRVTASDWRDHERRITGPPNPFRVVRRPPAS